MSESNLRRNGRWAALPGLVWVAVLATPARAEDSQDEAVAEVVVSESAAAHNGAVSDGYRVDRVDMGPLGRRAALDTPYTIQSIPAPLMENIGAHTLADVLKLDPSAQIEARGGIDVGRPQTRGFESDIVQNTRMDGMNVFGVTAYPMEQLERVEILHGLSGALYGPAAPAGTFNYVLKRPTEQSFLSLREGFDANGVWTSHGDAGGQIGAVGYRFNALHADGEGYVDGSTLRRDLISGALDLHASDNTVLELNASHYLHVALGYPGSFSYANTTALPKAPDATKQGYGQDFAGQHLRTDTASAKLRHTLANDWTVTAGYLRQQAERNLRGLTNTLAANGQSYSSTISTAQSGTTNIDSTLFYLNGKAHALGVDHELTLGANGTWQRQLTPKNTQSSSLGTSTLVSPRSYSEPFWQDLGPKYKSGENRQQSMVLGDTVTLSDQWSFLAAASQDWLQGHSWNSAGALSASYRASGISPTLSVMFKPVPIATLYATYADSLQKGDTAPTSGVSNAGQVLDPYRSQQWELGAKAALSGVDLNAALFRINRPFAYTTNNVFKEQGEQVNTGLELGARGQVVPGLTLIGGITLLDPKLTDTGNIATTDQLVVGVPRLQANLYAEYGVDHLLPGLTLTANLHHTGRRAANDTNTAWADAYSTVDIGARYTDDMWGENLTWRFGVNNLFDERYWASVFPSSINGTNSGNPSAFVGAPRTVSASVQITF